MEKYQDSILTKFNRDEHGNPISVNLVETQVVTKKCLVQLMQFPDEFHRVNVQDEAGSPLTETQNAYSIGVGQYYVNYANGVVYFHPSQVAKPFTFSYCGRGVEMISTSRIFHKYHEEGDEIVRTLTEIVDELVEASKDIVDEEQQRQQNELERIDRFNEQMNAIQSEIFDKDSQFQAQLGQQADLFDAKLQEVEDKILGEDNLFNQHLDQLDSRFDTQLKEWDEKVGDLSGEVGADLKEIKERLAVDLTQDPIYHKTLRGVRTSVMQQFAVLKDGTYLISQVGVTEAVEEGESFTLTRLTRDGSILDTMEILAGGHGWFQAHESEAGVELYFTSANERLIKTLYQPNHILDLRLTEGYQVLPNPTGERVLMAIDVESDRLLLMSRNAEKVYDQADIYSLSACVNGSQTQPSLTLTGILAEGQTMQGIGIQGNYAYFYAGAYGGKAMLRVFDLTTRTSADYHYPRLGYTHDNDTLTAVEAEGLFIDGSNLYVGVSTGTGGSTRYNHIYAFTSVENQAALLSDALVHAQTYKLIEGNGYVKPVYQKHLRLDQLTEPGEYYFSGKEFTFEDVPSEYKGSSGFFVHNSARAGDGTIFQTITRNTASRNCYRLGRQINGTTKVGAPWRSMVPERKVLYTGDARTLETINLTDSIANYDFLLVRLWGAGGNSQTLMIDASFAMSNKSLFIQSTNLPDSETSANFYAQELACAISADGRTLTQSRKSQVHIASNGTITRTEGASIGIQEIQGIRGFNVL